MSDSLAPASDYDPFAPAPIVELASTPGQREIWLSSHAAAGAGRAYNETFSIRLKGKVDDEALLAGLEALPDLHEALRGHFSEDGGRFVLEPSITLVVARRDLAEVPPGERASALATAEASVAEAPFDLETGPLFRAGLLRVGEDERVVLLCAHHAVCDGWSLDVLLSDLGRLYSAFSESAPLPPTPHHRFSDYVAYCATPNYRSRVEESLAFWRKKFGTIPPSLSFPCDGERPVMRSYGARYAQRSLPAELVASAKNFARARGLSFFSVLLSAYAAMIRRLAGASDFVIGIPVAGQPDAGMEDCVGNLVNLVPVRFAIDEGFSFLGLCEAANGAVLDARENASVGFGEIVATIALPRDPARVPLVAAVFTHVQKYAPEKLRFGSLAVEYRLVSRSFETFELNLNAIESKDGIEVQAHANQALFGSAWLDWRLRELEVILREGCRSASSPIDDLPFMPEEEMEIALGESGGGGKSPPAPRCAQELLSLRAVESGDRIALVEATSGGELSFAELEHFSGRIAEELHGRNLEGKTLGIFLTDEIMKACASLAIVRAGGAFLLLEPDDALERLRFMAQDARCEAILTETSLAARANEVRDQAIDIQARWQDYLREGPIYSAGATPDAAMCVLYPSDRSEKPSGVSTTYREIANRLFWLKELVGIRPGDRTAFDLPPGHVGLGAEYLWPIVTGSTVVTIAPGAPGESGGSARAIEASGVTVAFFEPASLRRFLAASPPRPGLRAALCHEGPLPLDLRDEHYRASAARLYSLYGDAESGGIAACQDVDPTDRRPFVPIGAAAPNTRLCVLDLRGRPAPLAAEGDLRIQDDRLSRTRDRARRLPDGTLLLARSPGLPEALKDSSKKVAPSVTSLSSIVRQVREIWGKQLGSADFGNEANLFDVGGNSFIALRIVLEAERAFDREIDLAVLFQYPTVLAFARFLAEGRTEGGNARLESGEAPSSDSVADRVRRRRESLER